MCDRLAEAEGVLVGRVSVCNRLAEAEGVLVGRVSVCNRLAKAKCKVVVGWQMAKMIACWLVETEGVCSLAERVLVDWLAKSVCVTREGREVFAG
jgi:hypothetical protein